jgi:hypothetical protein
VQLSALLGERGERRRRSPERELAPAPVAPVYGLARPFWRSRGASSWVSAGGMDDGLAGGWTGCTPGGVSNSAVLRWPKPADGESSPKSLNS